MGISPSYLDYLSIPFDFSLGYSDYPGFRCGTCHSYYPFDTSTQTPRSVLTSPLIVMESSILMNLSSILHNILNFLILIRTPALESMEIFRFSGTIVHFQHLLNTTCMLKLFHNNLPF